MMHAENDEGADRRIILPEVMENMHDLYEILTTFGEWQLLVVKRRFYAQLQP